MTQVQAKIALRHFTIESDEVKAAVADHLPDPIDDLFVVVEGRRFPPKQVISLVTGLDKADFNSHQARRVLGRLGFTGGRSKNGDVALVPGRSAQDRSKWPHQGREADALRPYMGKWVAQKGIEVLVAADTPQEIVEWLERHDIYADVMFRVPRDRSEIEVFPDVGWPLPT